MRIELTPFQISQIFMAQNSMKQRNWIRLTPTQSGIIAGPSAIQGQRINKMV